MTEKPVQQKYVTTSMKGSMLWLGKQIEIILQQLRLLDHYVATITLTNVKAL